MKLKARAHQLTALKMKLNDYTKQSKMQQQSYEQSCQFKTRRSCILLEGVVRDQRVPLAKSLRATTDQLFDGPQGKAVHLSAEFHLALSQKRSRMI
mmetsp:Transcript_38868/g.60540  ORF Transcript_38868/g.60540 Transcript_38868/m.60540 type:complete len:96 (+) Transcript_38868:260-547(+)